jgi:hypothetical protein
MQKNLVKRKKAKKNEFIIILFLKQKKFEAGT